MSNKEKLRKYKESLRDLENKKTIENIKKDIDYYGSFHIDILPLTSLLSFFSVLPIEQRLHPAI